MWNFANKVLSQTPLIIQHHHQCWHYPGHAWTTFENIAHSDEWEKATQPLPFARGKILNDQLIIFRDADFRPVTNPDNRFHECPHRGRESPTFETKCKVGEDHRKSWVHSPLPLDFTSRVNFPWILPLTHQLLSLDSLEELRVNFPPSPHLTRHWLRRAAALCWG